MDFPLFDYNEDLQRYEALHHPFTSPHPDDLPILEEKPLEVKARAYDLVLNGVELGGGSIRIHAPEVQKRVFRLLGIEDESAYAKFGFLLDALKYGAPPHGGIAWGLTAWLHCYYSSMTFARLSHFLRHRRLRAL